MREWDAEFSAYVASRYPSLLRTSFLLCGDHPLAEDLLQGVLARTYLAWPRIRRPESVDAYVRRGLVNARTSWWRHRRHREVPVATVPDRAAPEVDPFGDRSILLRHLAALPARQRAVVVLRYYEDLSEAEIAHALGCSPGTVKSQASRALVTLRARMAVGAAEQGGRP